MDLLGYRIGFAHLLPWFCHISSVDFAMDSCKLCGIGVPMGSALDRFLPLVGPDRRHVATSLGERRCDMSDFCSECPFESHMTGKFAQNGPHRRSN